MCGIVGIFGPKASEISLRRSVDLLINRGPDFQSIVKPNSYLSLGAARLAMTDPLPRSNQPFEKYENWIVFNGEVYNHNELREWLKSTHGVDFETTSDTEVLLEILRIYGAEGCKYLNGMFAFAYFDKSKRKLILGRDRLGKKPLFYSVKGKDFYWASTIEALGDIVNEYKTSSDAILSYLAFGYTIDPSTIYQDIKAVKPGHCFEVQAGIILKEIKSPIYELKLGGESGLLNVSEVIKSSVYDRIEGHNDIAISLSGGLDSSIIAQLSGQSNRKVVAYSLRWSDSDKTRYNTDFERAQMIAKSLNLKFVGVDFSSGDGSLEANLKDFVRYMGEPNSNPTGVSIVPFYRKISQDGFRLILTGDGSDEIFGGYPRYESPILGNRFRFLGDRSVASLINRDSNLGKIGLRFANPCSPGLWANFHWNFKPNDIAKLMKAGASNTSREIVGSLFSLISNLDLLESTCGSRDAIKRVMERDSSIWLSNESNRKLDRIAMAFSIEARSPFQDERVIKVASQVMREKKFKSHNKDYLRGLFPEVVSSGVRDDKAGFISPVGHWLRANPNILNTGLDAVVDSGFFNSYEIAQRRNDQFSHDFAQIRQLWSLVVLGYWFLHSWGQ